MNIRILSWETYGLRCPDMQVNFDEKKRIHFVQMPNGTGKTTVINLIKHTLSDNWKNVDINEFEDDQRNISEGLFKLSIQTKINNKKNKQVFKISFNFNDGTFDIKTTTGNQGERNGFVPSEEIEAFLTDKHIRTFIFKGDQLGSYFSPTQDIAIDTIDTFSGISKLSDLEIRLLDTFNKIKRGSIGNTQDKLQKEVDDLRDRRDDIQRAINTGAEEREKLSPQFDKLDAELQQKENKEKIRNNDLEILDEDIKDINGEINSLEAEIAKQLKNPYNISKALRDSGKTFLDQLEKQKLPGYAKEFLYELSEGEECICGEEITEAKKNNILENSNKYLGGDDANIVNRIKSENNDSISASLSDSKIMEENFQRLKDLNEECNKKNRDRKKLAAKIAKASGLFDKIKRRDDLKEKIKIIDDRVEEYKKIDTETMANVKKKDAKDINSIWGINNKLVLAEKKLAEKEGYISEQKALNLFIACLKDAAEDSRETIIDEIKTALNKKIHSTHKDTTFEIEKIDKCLNVRNQKGGGSGAQKVIAVTAFALSVLERSGVSFPLVIDHPVIAIEDESRSEFSKMIVEVSHQAINFVITGEKYDYIIEKDTGNVHSFLDEICTMHTIFRTDRGISLPKNMPNNIDFKSDNAVITKDRDYFINFSRK